MVTVSGIQQLQQVERVTRVTERSRAGCSYKCMFMLLQNSGIIHRYGQRMLKELGLGCISALVPEHQA